MNTLIEFEAKRLTDLLLEGDLLSIYLFMDSMSMPFDVQSKLMDEFAVLKKPDQDSIAALLESHNDSSLSEYLGF